MTGPNRTKTALQKVR